MLVGLILFFSGTLTSCQNANQQNCLSDEPELKQLDIDFRNVLKNHFKIDGELQNEDYKNYLAGIINEKISRDFFTNYKSVKKAQILKEKSSFNLIWNKMSLIEKETNKNNEIVEIEPPVTASGKTDNEKRDFYSIDIHSDFFNCLIENASDKDVKILFQKVQNTGSWHALMIGGKLIEIDNFEDSAVRAYIGIQFYYDFIFMMNGNEVD